MRLPTRLLVVVTIADIRSGWVQQADSDPHCPVGHSLQRRFPRRTIVVGHRLFTVSGVVFTMDAATARIARWDRTGRMTPFRFTASRRRVVVKRAIPGKNLRITDAQRYHYGETGKRYLLDEIPAGLWAEVSAKCKRDGVSVRALILKLLRDWLNQ